MRVLIFGDSITQGYWAVEHGWVDRLRMFFDSKQYQDLKNNDEPTIFNLGISADTSSDILARIVNEVDVRTRPHHPMQPTVVVQIGINDSARMPKNNNVSIEDYKNNLKSIAQALKDRTSQLIFVGFSACDDARTNPVSWGEFYYRNDDIKAYEQAMANVASELGIPFIPVFDEFKKQLVSGGDLLPDGLHPNEEGHELMYQIIKPKIEELLK